MKRIKYILAIFIVLLSYGVSFAAEASSVIKGVRIGEKVGYTRFVLDVLNIGKHEVFTVENPPRLVIDVKKGAWKNPKQDLKFLKKGNLIKDIRVGRPVPDKFRVVLDLKEDVRIREKFILEPTKKNKIHRLVIDFYASKQVAKKKPPTKKSPPKTVKKADPNLPASMAKKSESPKSMDDINDKELVFEKVQRLDEKANVPKPKPKPKAKKRYKGAKPIVVLDPGHGGIDPGAIGRSGTYEKIITFKYAVELKNKLEKSGRYKVYLTRKGDNFVNLRERVAIARKAKGDLFISLHADSHPNPKTRGLSVYTLSEQASDKEAAALAKKANREEVIGGVDLKDEDSELQTLLIDMVQRDTKNNSAEFAEIIVKSLGKEARLLKNTHRFAGFAVLTGADVPSALVELGYLSNRNEEKLLRTSAYRKKLVNALKEAIDIFFDKRGY